jgi:hypothetical protein
MPQHVALGICFQKLPECDATADQGTVWEGCGSQPLLYGLVALIVYFLFFRSSGRSYGR